MQTEPSSTTPWALRAWPPLMCPPERLAQLPLHFRHLSTRVTLFGDSVSRPAGQTMWAGMANEGEAGVAWDWVQLSRGVVAMADPMSVISNLCLVGSAGEVLTAWEAALYLNEIVHALPWQSEVQRALHDVPRQ